jgi:hypothetical protein
MSHRNLFRGLALAVTAVLSAGCGDEPTGPQIAATATFTVDATTTTQYVALTNGQASLAGVSDAASSTAWDLSFYTTTVASNANAGVTVACLCGNEGASGQAVMEMTAEGQLAAFEAVTVSDIPAASFTADAFATHRWYRYNITGTDNQIWPVFHVYLVKRGTAVYKVQVINYYNAVGAPRHVTFRYAKLQD